MKEKTIYPSVLLYDQKNHKTLHSEATIVQLRKRGGGNHWSYGGYIISPYKRKNMMSKKES